jgi:hypothetical protein
VITRDALNSTLSRSSGSVSAPGTFCCAHVAGVRCYGGQSRRLALLPDIEITVVLCDAHFAKLANRARSLQELAQKEVVRSSEVPQEPQPAEPQPSLLEQRLAEKTPRHANYQRCLSRYGRLTCRRKRGHDAPTGEKAHYYYSKTERVCWDENGLIS